MKYTREYFFEFVKKLPNINGDEKIFFYGILNGIWIYHQLTKEDKDISYEKVLDIVYYVLENIALRKGTLDKSVNNDDLSEEPLNLKKTEEEKATTPIQNIIIYLETNMPKREKEEKEE